MGSLYGGFALESRNLAADRAFSVEAAQVLRRALLAGLDQEAEWAERDVTPLLRGVSVAPDPAHKSVPSQSASIAVMKAIAERPAPALVDQLRSSLRAVRVSERGAEREFPVESAKGRVLPYPDKMLERIVTALDRQRRGQV